MIVRMFERVLCGLPANGSFAAILGTPAARLAAVGAVPVDPQIASLTPGEVGRRLVQAGPPHDSLPDGRHHLAVARSAAQQHPHATRRYAAHRQAATDSLGNRRRSGGAGWRNPRFGEQALRAELRGMGLGRRIGLVIGGTRPAGAQVGARDKLPEWL